jgi:Pentapeptide repeats (8 copies)
MRRSWVAQLTGYGLVVAGVAGILGLLWVVLAVAPPRFVQHRSLEMAKAQNEVRATLLQGLGGAALLLGVYFTYRQLRTTREGQITERYTRAIDQLGHAQLAVRLGGIYALERIARDSPGDRPTIAEVLTAFVRSHTPWPPSLPGQPDAATPIEEVPELQVRAADVQASLTVLGRGGFARPEGQGDLRDLFAVDLHSVDLRRAQLIGAHLERAFLEQSHLEGANLREAHLEGAALYIAHLEQAYLDRARLERARLHGIHLEGAYLSGAHLEGIGLDSAYLEGAKADKNTSWPEGFDWRAAGVTIEDFTTG